MKKIALLLILISTSFYGQNGKKNYKKIYETKVTYFTEELSLTPDQTKKFWPIYNQNRKHSFKLLKTKKRLLNNTDFSLLTKAETQALITRINNITTEIQLNKQNSQAEMLEIITTKQLLHLLKAEMSFKKKLLEKIKNETTN